MARSKTRTAGELDMAMLIRASRTLRVMAHPMRLKMAELLIGRPYAVGELAEAVDLPAAAVSQHLNNMRAHGIVECRREGRQVFYEVVNLQTHYMIDCLQNHSGEI